MKGLLNEPRFDAASWQPYIADLEYPCGVTAVSEIAIFRTKGTSASAFADKIFGRILRHRGGIAADGKSGTAEQRQTLLERESIRRRAINLSAGTIRNIRYRSALPLREGLLLFYTLPAARQAAPHRFRNSPHNVFRPNYAQCPQV